jgi:hypothetical protein
MNERIKELMEEAGGYGLPDRDGDRTPALVGKSVEKFAELIVRECASHLNWVGDDAAGIELLEHFGVENE